MKTGLFSRSLFVLPEEETEFKSLRKKLRDQLKPKTMLREICFEQILCLTWRSGRALLLEGITTDAGLWPKVHENSGGNMDGKCSETNTLSEWVGASNETLRAGIRFLGDLRGEIATYGFVRLEKDGKWKESIVKGFGQQFFDLLMQWSEFSPSAIYLGEHLAQHRAIFPPKGEDPVKLDAARVISDPKLKWQMAIKLIELHKVHLEQLLNNSSSNQSTAIRSEICPRYFAAACRDLERAVNWYLHLRASDL